MPVHYRSMDEMARERDQYIVAKAMMVDEKDKIDTALAHLPQDLRDRF